MKSYFLATAAAGLLGNGLAMGAVNPGFVVTSVETTTPEIRRPVFENPDQRVKAIRQLCAVPAAGHSLYIPGFATALVSNRGDLKFPECDNGTATLVGTAVSKSNPWKKLDVFVEFADLEGSVDNHGWHYYHSMWGDLVGVGEANYFNVGMERRGGAFQVGYSANKKNDAYGAAGWFEIYGSQDGHGDINVNLVSCKKPAPKAPEWVSYEVTSANGSGCPSGNVSIGNGSNQKTLDLNIPMISLETDRFAREFCQASVRVNRPAGWQYAIKGYHAWYKANLADGTKAKIDGSAYFQGSDQTQTFSTSIEGRINKNRDIHQSVKDSDLIFSDCNGDRDVNLKTAANVRSGWGALTVKSLQRYDIVWRRCK